MKIDDTAKYILQKQMEEALHHYDSYRKGKAIPHVMQAVLDVLDENDKIGTYISNKLTYRTRPEYDALKDYTKGVRIENIRRKYGKQGFSFDECQSWFYGAEGREGFLTAMFDELLKLNEYCPFCNASGVSGAGDVIRFNGKVCPHKEIAWEEE